MSQVTTDGQPVHVGTMTIEQLEKIIESAVSLAVASSKRQGITWGAEEIQAAAKATAGHVLEGMRATEYISAEPGEAWQRQILWVDDRPDNNIDERRALESLGLEFTLARPLASSHV